MQSLILLAGEAWTGKSTCAKLLYTKFANSAWLDGDDVWRVNPFSVDDPRLRNSDLNMAFILDNYLKSRFEYVIFSSIVLCDKDIREKIINLISSIDYIIKFFTLTASKNVLKKRAMERDSNCNPEFHLLKESLEQESIFIDTNNKTPEEVVVKIISEL